MHPRKKIATIICTLNVCIIVCQMLLYNLYQRFNRSWKVTNLWATKIKVLHIVWSKLGHYVTLTTTIRIRVPREGGCNPLQHFPTSLVSEVTFYMGQGSAKTRALISRGARCGCAAAHLHFEGNKGEFFHTQKIFLRP